MTGPAAMMPPAPLSPALLAGAAKIATPAKSAELGKGERGGFGDMLTSVMGEAETPELDAEAKRDDTPEPLPPPFGMPVQLPIIPEKTPRLRFAEELSVAAFPVDTAQETELPATAVSGGDAEADALAEPPTGTETPAKTEFAVSGEAAAVAMSQRSDKRPVAAIREMPVQPVVPAAPLASGAIVNIAASAPDEALNVLPEAPALAAPAEPIRSAKERSTAKASKVDSSVANAHAAATIADGIALAAPRPAFASFDRRSRGDGEQGNAMPDFALLKDANVSTVQQETHFAPSPQQSPAFQIANRIMQDVEASDPALAVQPATSPNDAPAAAPVKVLELRLDPPDLGGLTIRLSMKDDALHLRIEASRHETARLIERDREALSGMLRSAGYGGDGLSVQITSGDRGNGAQQFNGGSGFNQPAGQNSAGRQPENNGSGQAWQRALEAERTAEPARETEAPGAPRSRGGPVYL